MRPSEVRKRVIAEHAALRQALERLEALANQVLAGRESRVDSLRRVAADLLNQLREHMDWEEVHLATALHTSNARGDERVELLARDRRERRELMQHLLGGLGDASRPTRVIAMNLLDFCSLLRDEIVDEEKMILDERAMRDDFMSPDAESG